MSQWHHRLTPHTDTQKIKNKTPVVVLPLTFWCFCCTVLTSSLTWMTRCWSLEWTSEELQLFRVLFSLHCKSNNLHLITSVYLKRTVLAPPPLNPFRFAAPASARVGNTDGLRAATDHYWKFLTLTLNVNAHGWSRRCTTRRKEKQNPLYFHVPETQDDCGRTASE